MAHFTSEDPYLKTTTSEGNRRETRTSATHPAFGTVGISRVQSSPAALFMSGVSHHNVIRLRIHEAILVTNGSHEYPMTARRMIEVDMSEAQFAQMITQPNQGEGTPCTIRYVAGEESTYPKGFRPPCPDPDPLTHRYKMDLKKATEVVDDQAVQSIAAVTAMFNGTEKVNKTTLKSLLESLQVLQRTINDRMPYVIQDVEEGIEKRTSEAKVEFETYMTQSLVARGLDVERMQQGAQPLRSCDQGSPADGYIKIGLDQGGTMTLEQTTAPEPRRSALLQSNQAAVQPAGPATSYGGPIVMEGIRESLRRYGVLEFAGGPSTPVAGQIWLNTTSGNYEIFDGGVTRALMVPRPIAEFDQASKRYTAWVHETFLVGCPVEFGPHWTPGKVCAVSDNSPYIPCLVVVEFIGEASGSLLTSPIDPRKDNIRVAKEVTCG